MEDRHLDLINLYLPLLNHPQLDVRRQASLIFYQTYGESGLAILRDTSDDVNPVLRQQVRHALQTIHQFTNPTTYQRPLADMYITCLGRLRLFIDGDELQPKQWAQTDRGRAGYRKMQGVFAYLVHCGRNGASRSELTQAIWDTPPGPTSLSRTLTTLRQLLLQVRGDVLTVTREFCMLSPDSYETDVEIFERIFNRAVHLEETQGLTSAIALYDKAVQCYTGPYMGNVLKADGWAQERRDQLMNYFVIALERLTEDAFDQQNYQQCITLCQRAIDVDATADDVTVWLLRAYDKLGLYDKLDETFQRYLGANSLDVWGFEASQDLVVRAYQDLIRMRAI